MNREIKFRVWDSRKNIMFYDIQKSFEWFDALDYPKYYTLMQFTGLQDKNGRDIYEGDIVDYRYDGMSEFEAERWADILVSPVFWDCERWRIKYSAASYAWHIMKVVGNIFENPELLQPCFKN